MTMAMTMANIFDPRHRELRHSLHLKRIRQLTIISNFDQCHGHFKWWSLSISTTCIFKVDGENDHKKDWPSHWSELRMIVSCLILSSKFLIFLHFAPVGPPDGPARPTNGPTSRPTGNLTARSAGGSSARPTVHEWPPSENKIEIFEQISDFDPLRPSGRPMGHPTALSARWAAQLPARRVA